jgi:hypothetical protein
MEFIEKFRKTLVRWHVAPLTLLGVLVHIMYILIDKLNSFPACTEVGPYTVFAGLVGGVLTAMFAAFRLLLTGIKKEHDDDQP